jgi:hypothetical protein
MLGIGAFTTYKGLEQILIAPCGGGVLGDAFEPLIAPSSRRCSAKRCRGASKLTKQAHCRLRQAIFDQIRMLRTAGTSIRDIAKETGFGSRSSKYPPAKPETL